MFNSNTHAWMYGGRPIGYGNQALGQLVAGITTRLAGDRWRRKRAPLERVKRH